MSHNKELELIIKFHNAGIINQEELKKAELYLSLSTKAFSTYEDALEWLIYNRAVSRDRQDQVKAAFAASRLSETTPSEKAEIAAPIDNNFFTDKVEIAKPADKPEPKVLSTGRMASERAAAQLNPNQIEIYNYNIAQLDVLVNKGKITPADKKICQEKLKNCYYCFYDNDDLSEWIESDYETPINLNAPQVNADTLLLLYTLVKENAITDDEYWDSYYELSEVMSNPAHKLAFENKFSLFNWLAGNDCLYHGITDYNHAKNYNVNLALLHKITYQGNINSETYHHVSDLLRRDLNVAFNNEQAILEWIDKNGLRVEPKKVERKTKKKRPPFFFILLVIYVLYRIFSGIIPDKEISKPILPKSPKPAVIAENICYDPQLVALIRRESSLNNSVKHLGTLNNISQIKSIGKNTCQVLAAFPKGTAQVTFHVTNNQENRISLSRFNYSNIQENNVQNAVNSNTSPDNYEAVVLDGLGQIDRLITEKQPDATKLTDMIESAKIAGQCRKDGNGIITCPFIIYYKKIWAKNGISGNYHIDVQFIDENNNLKLKSLVDFMKDLADGLYQDFQKRSAQQ